MPLTITVVTAVYNGAETIASALDSVRSQDWPNVEHVVVDGGSTDGTLHIVQQSLAADRGSWISEPDRGVYDALNKGIARSQGDVIGLLHADDVYANSGVLSKVAQAFADPSVESVYGDLEYISRKSGAVIRRWRAGQFSPAKLAYGWMPPHPTFYARRRLFERLGCYDIGYRIAADYDLLLRFLARGGVRVAYVPEVLVRMRTGGLSNRSLSNILQKSREDYKVLRSLGVGGLGALCWKNLSKVAQFF